MAEPVIELAKRPQRLSTSNTYSGQWENFVTFCRDRDWKPFEVSESDIAEYLLTIFNKGCMPSTVKVHRAAVLSVLKHVNPSLCESVLIGDLMSRLEIERPRNTRTLPKFDIDLVLRQLLRPPFVDHTMSDTRIPLTILTYKTAFLLALATGARSSEVHAFTRSQGRFKFPRIPPERNL